MKNCFWSLLVFGLLVVSVTAFAQQGDIAVGISTPLSSSNTSSSLQFPVQPLKGGAYPAVSADVIFHNRLGFGGEVFWRESRGIYSGFQPYRPIFYDVNAIYQPQFGKKAGAEIQAGIGGLSTRFYNNTYTCNFVTCTNYSSSSHFSAHFGGGLRYYFWHSFFIRPEAHIYFVPNNHEFSTNAITRVGASIGYTLRPE